MKLSVSAVRRTIKNGAPALPASNGRRASPRRYHVTIELTNEQAKSLVYQLMEGRK